MKTIKNISTNKDLLHKILRINGDKSVIESIIHIIEESEFEYKVKQDNLDQSWDFKNSNTKEYTHCFHAYPAMMIPQVARRIIENYGKKAKILFDPYCGTGTSLVEANLFGINAIGTDINPLARLIASAKTTKLDINVLDSFIYDLINYYLSINFNSELINSTIIPEIKNIDYWFSPNVQRKLGILLKFIEKIDDIPIKNFFKVAFSETVRESSYIKTGEFKLVRAKNISIKENIDVFKIIIKKLVRNKKGLIEFINSCNSNVYTKIYDFDTVKYIPENIIKPNSIDIILTSPPYGDSRTTVAYGQYSRLSNEWLGYKNANIIDRQSMGGEKKRNEVIDSFKSEILIDIISTIQKVDKKRAEDVVSFFNDYNKSIKNISTIIKKGGYACYVVGNRTVKGVKIPTDKITAQLFENNGFIHLETIMRNIPNKRMPLKNSPSNITGETASTIKNEYIVICQKK